jgi:hypothetical protein
MDERIHPSETESEFLNIAYNRFIDLFREIIDDEFWEKDPKYRLYRTKEIFSVYSEILKYPPIQWVIEDNKRPNFSDVGGKLFRFVRNVLLHFPFFDEWDTIWIKRSIVNLYSTKPQFIDRFLSENEGKEDLKYRFWEKDKKRMTYVSIRFPLNYKADERIHLKDIIKEKEGVKFSIIFMDSILRTQIEELKET